MADDPRLIDVAAECRRLRHAVADAEWEGDIRLPQLAEQLRRMEALQAEGVLYDPIF